MKVSLLFISATFLCHVKGG